MDRTNRIFKLISVILMTMMFLFVSCSSESSDDDDNTQTQTNGGNETTTTTAAVTGSNPVRSVTTAANSSSVVLAWLLPSDTSNYGGVKITWNGGYKSIYSTKKTTYTISGLTANTSYTFKITTMDKSWNETSSSVSISITTGKANTSTDSGSGSKTKSEYNEMAVTLTPSTTQATDENVTVNIKIATVADGIKTVKYASGEKTLSYFTASGTEISADDSGEYNFSVSVNGTYTAYVVDSEGRRETRTIEITNINSKAPAAVSDFYATYSSSGKKISVTWATTATNISYYLVSYYVESGDSTTVFAEDEKVTDSSYSVSDVSTGSGTYIFSVKAVDNEGLIGTETTTSVTPTTGAAISKIELDKYHVLYTDRTVNVTVVGMNFDKISDASNQTIQIQVISSDGGEEIYLTTEAEIDVENNKATATIEPPSDSSDKGSTYIVRANFLGSIDTDHVAKVNVSAYTNVSAITLSTSEIDLEDVDSTTVTTATVTGTNFDLTEKIAIQLYSTSGSAYGDEIAVDSSSFTKSTSKFSAEIPVPQNDDVYIVKILTDGKAQGITTKLTVNGSVPKFTKFKIPKAGISASGGTVEATVIGKNFTVDGVDSSSFAVTCGTSSVSDGTTVKIISDTLLTCTLNIPSTASKYIVTVTSGTKSIKGTFTVKDYSAYAVGDIVLADGTLVPVAKIDSYTEDSSNPAVAVIGGFNSNGAAIGVGLKQSGSYLEWAPSETTGYETNFTDIASNRTYSSTEGEYVYTGDTDGSNNWDIVSAIDPLGANKASTNYPAFNFAASYADNRDYSGDIASGWYLPAASEIYTVKENYSTVNTSMDKVGGTKIYHYTSYYWSSSQASSGGAVYYLSNYSISTENKSSSNYALVIRQF